MPSMKNRRQPPQKPVRAAPPGNGAASFGRGFADALPICFGYFAVGFTVAVAAVVHGHPVWSPLLLSLTHVSGTRGRSRGGWISRRGRWRARGKWRCCASP